MYSKINMVEAGTFSSSESDSMKSNENDRILHKYKKFGDQE